MKRTPSIGEVMQAADKIGSIVMEELEAAAAANLPPPGASDEALAAFRNRVRDRFFEKVSKGEVPDLEWPSIEVQRTGDNPKLFGVFFKGSSPLEGGAAETPEAERANLLAAMEQARHDGAAMWSMMRDAITEAHAFSAPPPCHLVTMGLALFAALRSEGLSGEAAIEAAVYQVLNHECRSRPAPSSSRGAPC